MQTASEKKKRRDHGTGSVYKPKESRFFWIKFYVGGIAQRESTQTESLRKARKFLQARLSQVQNGAFAGVKADRIRVGELADDFVRDYRVNGRRSLDDVTRRWNLHLRPFFGHMRASAVSTELIKMYVEKRLEQGAAVASINRELAALRRMLRLGAESTPPKVQKVPRVKMLKEQNVRTGFVEDDQYQRLAFEAAKAGLWFRALIEVAYTYGWRLGELLNLRVRQVDLLNRVIRLEPGSTKNDEGREVTMTKSVYVLLQGCIIGKQPDDAVFARENGQPVREIRYAWARACSAANLGHMICARCGSVLSRDLRCSSCSVRRVRKAARYEGLLFHDLRRTAARNLRRAGVAEGVIMKIGGWRTRVVFERYAIVSQSDVADAMGKLETLHDGHKLGIEPDLQPHAEVASQGSPSA